MVSRGWRVSVDPRRCIGTGICTSAAPGYFVLIEGLSQPLARLIDPADSVLYAAESCPMEAIEVRDADDHRLISPEP